MKKILGLDLGTNSIGWAVVEIDNEKRIVRIIALGSRILPMDAGEISTFETGGKLKSSASDRTDLKSKRKNIYRFLLRRDRLHCVLNLLGILPEHYKLDIEFINNKGKRSGKIKSGKEPKLAYYTDEKGKKQFLFMDSYNEMEKEFKSLHPNMFYKKKNGKETKLPYDWTLYYLREKALSQALTDEELAWVIMSFLPKRGYEKVMGMDEKEQKEGELSETINTKVISIEELKSISKNDLKQYKVKLADSYGNIVFEYIEEASYQISQIDEFKQIEKISKLDEDGNIKSTNISICEIKNLGIEDIIKERNKEKIKFIIKLSSGWDYEYLSKYEPKQDGTTKDFIIKSTYDIKGNFKNRTIRMPQKDDWELIKLRTEKNLIDHNTKNNIISVASYIYDALLKDPSTKIKAGLVTTIERKFYEDELRAILDSQKRFHPYLKDEQKYKEAITLLYPNNDTHRNSLYNKQDFNALLGEDIIFYQRDLKSKKSLIANCKYESRTYTSEDGETITTPLKCIPKSNPYYQEFRLWQFIKRLRIIQLESENNNGEKLVNQDITEQILTNSIKESLFSFLNNRKEASQNVVLKALRLDAKAYKWNFEENHIEPCNETRYDFILRLKRIKNFEWEKFLDAKSKVHIPDGKKNHKDSLIDGCSNEYLLWHFFYSVKKKDERVKGLPKLIEKLLNNAGLDLSWKNKVVEMLSSFSTYKNDYGTYSEKAIKKLLPFMRLGKYWNKEDVEKAKTVKEIKPEVLTTENINGKEITDFQGLWVSSACYLVYGRYSEVGDAKKWTQPYDIIKYLKDEFGHNSLNNPVVEKVVRETLMVVHDIWTTYGEADGTFYDEKGNEQKAYKKFFDKINIEIGTSLKKNNDAKDSDSKKNEANRLANERARALLKELKATYHDANIKENSPYQQEKIRIVESDIVNSIKYDKDDKKYQWGDEVETTEKEFTKKEINEFLKKEISEITPKDIERYRLWLDQRYLSPYTGEPISLSKLLNREEYEIEHIFPQERVTLNAMCNKVICEKNVNKLKGARTGYEFILEFNGKIKDSNGNIIKLLTPKEYVDNVKKNINDKDKREILLSKDIPDKFGNNQMNNMRYISKFVMGLMSNIVREDDEKEFKSKNVLVISGSVTSILKNDWQLDDAWNEIIKPRFLHINNLLDTDIFGTYRIIDGHSVFVPSIPRQEIKPEEGNEDENEEILSKGIKINFDTRKKRIDHRHHALDALIVALATNNHVNYINNVSSLDINSDRKNERKDLKTKYMITKKHDDGTKDQYFLPPMQYKENGNIVPYLYVYKQSEPQHIFKDVAIEALQNTLATFKQKNHLMRQRINWIQQPNDKKNIKESDLNKKNKYSVRLSLHKDTFYGKRKIRPVAIEIAINKLDKIVENKVKNAIRQYMQEGKNNDEIINEIKKTHEVVYVYEDCSTTQRNHTLDYFANIKEKDTKKGKKEKPIIIEEIENVADITIQNILKKHLYKYDSIQMPVAEAINYYNDIVDETDKVLVDKYKATENGGEKKVDVYIRNKQINNRENIKHNPQVAFSSDGIKELNDNIVMLNNGKLHKPIYKVQIIQALGKKFQVSEPDPEKKVEQETVKNKQYVISDADSYNYCGVYKSKEGKTKVYIPSLKITIKSIKNDEILIPEIHPDDASFKYSFTLSPLDMVYMPTDDEIINGCNSKYIDYERIYVVNDFNEHGTIYFRKYNFAKEIILPEMDLQKDKGQLKGSRVFKTANHDGKIIRDYCVPIKVDRLGNIIEINGKKL